MERAVAKVTFEGIDAGGDTSASEAEEGGSSGSEEERETRLMVTQRNKKGKKSGGFQSMGLSHPVFKGVMKKGYRLPTPIQRKCIPLVMDGKDVVAMARTGSGKTAAFLIPMFEHLKAHSAKVGARALILSPTRELATQTKKFTRELGKFTGLRCALVLGGDSIIATPGRFLHLVVEMELRLSSIGYVVFDEADRLFEMGFSEQLHEIIRRLPESRQTLLLSATLPKLLVEFAKAGLKDPVLVRLDVDSKLSEQLKLSFFSTRLDDKPAVLLHLLHHVIPPTEQTVIFAPTKHHVEYLKELLQAAGVDATFIYSALDQTARKINVAKFTNKKTLVMIVTDVAARGIDIPMLDNVINYNFPAKPKLFVHRVGRVARAGRSGSAFSLVSPDELAYMLDLHLFVGRAVVPAGGREASGVFGSIPQSVIDIEDGFIQQSLSTSSDLSSLKLVADNAQKQYVRSRPTAAPESVKRVKDFPPSLPLHPIFEEQCSSHDLEKNKFLGALKSYRPSQTIFEIHSTAKASAKQVMRTKREHHGGVVSARQSTRAQQQALGTGEAGPSTQEQSREEDLRDFQTEESVSHRKRKGAKKAVKDDNYVRYAPPDMYSEKGLSLGTSFNQQAAGAALDIEGDEGTGLQRSKSRLKWDRKRKRFVGESGKEGQKKMKTESGNWISASYKSNAYKEWMERHKMEGALVGTEEESAGAAAATTWSKGRGAAIRGGRGAAIRGGRGAAIRGGRGVAIRGGRGAAIRGGRGAAIRGGSRRTAGTGRGREVAGTGKGGEAGGLRSRSEILRKRKQREFQEGRKKIKAGRKKAGPAKGGGGGRGMNKRR